MRERADAMMDEWMEIQCPVCNGKNLVLHQTSTDFEMGWDVRVSLTCEDCFHVSSLSVTGDNTGAWIEAPTVQECPKECSYHPPCQRQITGFDLRAPNFHLNGFGDLETHDPDDLPGHRE
jgi:hypothetical protein